MTKVYALTALKVWTLLSRNGIKVRGFIELIEDVRASHSSLLRLHSGRYEELGKLVTHTEVGRCNECCI